jgi:PhoH-like ATPase
MPVANTRNGKPGIRKTYILDTNVLLHDPTALFGFEENIVVIPIVVVEEIDRFKRQLDDVGRNARMISRDLDALREKGRLAEGVALDNGGVVRVEMASSISRFLPQELSAETNDNLILSLGVNLKEEDPSSPVILVSKDTNLRIKADVVGLTAQDYRKDKVPIEQLYSGCTEREVSAENYGLLAGGVAIPAPPDLLPNQGCFVRASGGGAGEALLVRQVPSDGTVRLLPEYHEAVWGILPRNPEQRLALTLLLDDSVSLISLVGIAGTGKTLLALAAGLRKVVEEKKYRRLLISRPVFPLGRDIGFLPGDIEEKLNPYMQPLYDNLRLLTSSMGDEKGRGDGYRSLFELGMVEVEPLTYIRGRSLPHQFLIVDEAQNLTPHEIKTIITRAGEETKVVLTGDPYQIDNPYIDSSSNGLTYLVERFKEQPVAAAITLTKGERSPLAELAAKIL